LQCHFTHGAQRNPGVAQLAFDDGPNLFFQGLTNTLQVMLLASLLGHFPA
jgi:hypothetical protein